MSDNLPAIRSLQAKYRLTSRIYDLLDYPWERQYRKWRPRILQDLQGRVLEAGVGTGRNLPYYPAGVDLTAIDLSGGMLREARKRMSQAKCRVRLEERDATALKAFAENTFDGYVATFLYCVLPDELQRPALEEMSRILKPGGRFRLVEILYSSNSALRIRQRLLAPFVGLIYGARFDRKTLERIHRIKSLKVTRASYLKADTYLLIEGEKERK